MACYWAFNISALRRFSKNVKWTAGSLFKTPSSLCLKINRFLLSTVYCLLCIVYCLLSTVYCLLSPVFCLLSTFYCLLFTVYCLLYTVIIYHLSSINHNPLFDWLPIPRATLDEPEISNIKLWLCLHHHHLTDKQSFFVGPHS